MIETEVVNSFHSNNLNIMAIVAHRNEVTYFLELLNTTNVLLFWGGASSTARNCPHRII